MNVMWVDGTMYFEEQLSEVRLHEKYVSFFFWCNTLGW